MDPDDTRSEFRMKNNDGGNFYVDKYTYLCDPDPDHVDGDDHHDDSAQCCHYLRCFVRMYIGTSKNVFITYHSPNGNSKILSPITVFHATIVQSQYG